MKRKKDFFRPTWILLFIFVILCSINTAFAAPELTIENYQLVSSKRVSRFEFVYTYRADITNNGSNAAKNIVANLTVSTPGVTVIKGDINFSEVQPQTTSTSSDTFIINHNRRYRFNEEGLEWSMIWEPVGNGTLLAAEADELAIDAVYDLIPEHGVPISEMSENAEGAATIRTQLEIAFYKDATSGEINDLLDLFGGRIFTMLEGVAILGVSIPDPNNLLSLIDLREMEINNHPRLLVFLSVFYVVVTVA